MGKKKAHQSGNFAGVDIDDPKLPQWVSEAAIHSGGYPYERKMPENEYADELYRLQIELAKLQKHVIASGERIAIVVEGRDAAGKGGAIKRFTEYLNPRTARIAALPKPSDAERGQWYFQRYVQHLPTRGNIVLFDRSWYNRAGVERVFGFCSEEEYLEFFRETPDFERLIQQGGIRLFKFWLSIGREMQLQRLHARRHDPLKQWKLTDIDLQAIPRWKAYSEAAQAMFQFTHSLNAPWWVVRANDKRRARLAFMRKVLLELDYDQKDPTAIGACDDKLIGNTPEFFRVD